MSASERVAAWLERFESQEVLHNDIIHGFDGGAYQLRASDLRELIRQVNEYHGLLASEAALRRLVR